jgi:hypothetical protein
MTPAQSVTKRLNALGYELKRNDIDAWGRRWKFTTLPLASGPINRFNTLHEVSVYADQVYRMRQWNQQS